MRNLFYQLLCCAVAWLNLAGCDGPPPRSLVIHAGRVLDGVSDTPRHAMRITVQEGVITALESDTGPLSVNVGTHVDAHDLTIMPGLIDAHTHAFGSAGCTPSVAGGLRQSVRNLHAYLRAGITTVADLGAPTALSLSARRYVGNGQHHGPRLWVCGAALRAPAGYPTFLPADTARDVVRDVSGPSEARAAVRNLADAGVNCITVYLQEQDFDGRPLPVLDDATLCAIVHEAHRQELRAFVHTLSDQGYQRALACGADALAHGAGEPLSEATRQLLLAHPTPVIPTHWAFEAFIAGPQHLDRLDYDAARLSVDAAARADMLAYAAASRLEQAELPSFVMSHMSRAKTRASVTARLENTRWLAAQRLPLALGTDSAFCFNWPGDPAWELQRFVDAGMSPAAALRAATTGSATVLNLQDAIGKLAVDYRADLIAVHGNPDENIRALRAVRWVMVDGVMQRLDGRWYEPALLAWEMFRTWISG